MDRMNQEAKNGVCDDYKRQIIDMVGKIENKGMLEYLHTFIRLILEKWG